MPIFLHSYLLLYLLILISIFSSSLSPTLSTFKNHCPFLGSFIYVLILSTIFFFHISFTSCSLTYAFFVCSFVLFFLNNTIMMFIHFMIDVFGSFSSASFFFSPLTSLSSFLILFPFFIYICDVVYDFYYFVFLVSVLFHFFFDFFFLVFLRFFPLSSTFPVLFVSRPLVVYFTSLLYSYCSILYTFFPLLGILLALPTFLFFNNSTPNKYFSYRLVLSLYF
jgi:hypothetical protein